MNGTLKFIPRRAAKTRRATRIVLPVQHVNSDAVRAFMRDYMVPVLAKEFLRLRNVAPNVPIEVKDDEQTSGPVGKEDGL